MMKLFQNFEKFLIFAVSRAKKVKLNARLTTNQASDLDTNQVKTQKFGLKNLPPYIWLVLGVAMTLTFLIFEAQEFVEYSESFYPFVTALLNLCNISVMIRNGAKLFQLIDHLERETQKRKIHFDYFLLCQHIFISSIMSILNEMSFFCRI